MSAANGAFDRLRAAAPTLSVGMVTADLGSLASEMQLLADSGVQVVHFDVMDGVFCPMMTIGPPTVKYKSPVDEALTFNRLRPSLSSSH